MESGNPRAVQGLSELSNSGVRRYSDIGEGGIEVAIHGWSGDCQSNSGVWGYSDIGGGIAVAIHGRSGDCLSNSGVRGNSDMGGV